MMACSVFFIGDLVTLVETPDRADASRLLLLRAQPGADLLERQVRFSGNEIKQPLPVRLEGRTAMACAGLRFDTAGRRPPLDPANGVEAPRLSRRAASRALSPASTIDTTRTLRSFEYPFAIARPRRCRRRNQNLICAAMGIPCGRSDSHQAETALAPIGLRAGLADLAHLKAQSGPPRI